VTEAERWTRHMDASREVKKRDESLLDLVTVEWR
jgi:hypothetical protein